MQNRLLEILASPCCQNPLEMKAESVRADEIESGELRCACGAVYPVRGGIPRFVPDDGYAAPFTLEWRAHRTTQLDPSESTVAKLRKKTGLGSEELSGALVLEAGVGMGRYADVAERLGAEVVGFDLSGSVDAARENFRGRRRIHLTQADLYRPPFRQGTFDVIYSIGVLSHTPDPRAGFLRLVPLLKPGGIIAVSLYGHSPRFWYMIDFWRRFTTRLPPHRLYRLSRFVARRVYPVFRLKPFRPLLILFPIPDEPNLDWRILNTFNLYAPKYQSKHTYWEVWQWFREAGLDSLEILPQMVAIRGRRPLDERVAEAKPRERIANAQPNG